MKDHVRIAVYTLKKGPVEEVVELAEKGMLPIFKGQPGFLRYGLAQLDDGKFASVSIWETHDEAEAATAQAADFVAKNLADRVDLESSHVGDFFFDEST